MRVVPKFKKLFRSPRKTPKTPAGKPSDESLGGTTACDSEASTISSAKILERTRIHTTLSTAEEVSNVQGDSLRHKPEDNEKLNDALCSSGAFCCNLDSETVREIASNEDGFSLHERKVARSITTESIECVYEGDRRDCVERIPSLLDTQSMSKSTSFDPEDEPPLVQAEIFGTNEHTPCCTCNKSSLPPLDPKLWPQAPLLLRPQPNSGTRILGIRYEDSIEYLWKVHDNTPWWHVLQQEWGRKENPSPLGSPHCEFCAILPINNGNEAKGKSLVADFETSLFRGTLMLRLRHSEGTTSHPSDDKQGFFAGVPFRYQAVIRGQFRTEIPFTELLTGTKLERPCGKLPPKWVLWTALKLVRFFAPQLKTKLDLPEPYSLSPLGSAPRSISVEDQATSLLSDDHVEPTTPECSLTRKAYPISNQMERARARKRHFDQMFVAKSKQLLTDPSKTYTMNFLQHMLDYQKFALDLGSFHMNVKDILDGQPLQLMAIHGDHKLWSFEIWNEILLENAKKYL